MKIMQIITLCELGGAQSVVVNLANSLCRNHEVIVVAGEGDGKMWKILDNNVRRECVKYLKRAVSPIYDLLTLLCLLKLYFKYKPDIIHLHSSKIGVLGRLVFPKLKIVYTVHGFDSVRIAFRNYLPIERFLQYSCKAIVGVSSYDVNNMKVEGINNAIWLVYNGIVKPKSLAVNPLSFCDNYKRKVLCIARLSPPKNVDLFLKVATLLPQYAFIWVGNQCNVNRELASNIFFMGNQLNAGAYNEFIDLFLLPSDYEGLPIVILEAMSYGKPVVASNVGGISEIVRDGENGYVVENTVENFVDKITYILEHDEIYDFFSINSLKRYTEDLAIEKMVDAYMKIYESN